MLEREGKWAYFAFRRFAELRVASMQFLYAAWLSHSLDRLRLGKSLT